MDFIDFWQIGGIKGRCNALLAMNYVAHMIDSDEIFNEWEEWGIPDYVNTVDDFKEYANDVDFIGTMTVFLNCIAKAAETTGLFYDGLRADMSSCDDLYDREERK